MADDVRAELTQLSAQRESFEAILSENIAILQQEGATMSSPLVDSEGFPRADVDIPRVRGARVAIIRARNDLKEIQDKLAAVVARGLPRQPEDDAPNGAAAAAEDEMDLDAPDAELKEFARINGVHPGGPGDDAGLKRDDLLLSIGSRGASNRIIQPIFALPTAGMARLATVVNAAEGRELPLVVKRGEQILELILRPRQGWGGRGVLGCHVVPV